MPATRPATAPPLGPEYCGMKTPTIPPTIPPTTLPIVPANILPSLTLTRKPLAAPEDAPTIIFDMS